MATYKLKLPTKEEESRKKLDAVRHPKLLNLKGKQIGPLYLPDPDRQLGMRGVESKKTKNANWVAYREQRKKKQRMARASRRRND